MDTVIQQVLSGNVNAGKQRKHAQYTGEYNNGTRSLEQFLAALICRRAAAVSPGSRLLPGLSWWPASELQRGSAAPAAESPDKLPSTLSHRRNVPQDRTETVLWQIDDAYTHGSGSVRRSAANGVQQRRVAALTSKLIHDEITVEHFLEKYRIILLNDYDYSTFALCIILHPFVVDPY
ncbi:hypothetical protein T03_16376 [Trichinella britovi]|uniref:Uncharacterized protein n=1 Tax=Trichinella britovi TaxID=45882 RepID=A0A0V1C7I4_TRIBR|nr:hypothetical protein T03_16376 [Trichinella britovi]